MPIPTAARAAATLTAAVALIATATATATASAAPSHGQPFLGRAASFHAVPADDSPNPDFAGFIDTFTETGSGTSFRTDFTVSRINCDAKPANPLFTVADASGEDADGNFESSGAIVTAQCVGKTPTYSAVVLVDSETESAAQPVSPGDTIIVRATVAPDSVTAQYNDVNNQTSSGEVGSGYTVSQSLDAVEGSGGSDYPRFYKPVEFRNIRLDKVGYSDAQGFDQVDTDGNVVISGGSLNTKGNAFTATWMGNKTNG